LNGWGDGQTADEKEHGDCSEQGSYVMEAPPAHQQSAALRGLGACVSLAAARVSISDSGGSVNVSTDADGNAANGFEVLAATLNTTDTITVGEDVIVGS
jgi:hypothetical protein